MRDLIRALVARRRPVGEGAWREFFGRLHDGRLARSEAVAVLVSLSTRFPDSETVGSLLSSLKRESDSVAVGSPLAVNIVGTGGGPETVNVSTAAAFVAATLGVKVIKTGSRAYSGRCGSVDLLRRLGVPLTVSHEQTEASLDRFGIACVGSYVYPSELVLLAKLIQPFDMNSLGRFFNVIGPFLAQIPIHAQVTGVSDATVLPTLKAIVAQVNAKRLWLCHNAIGADELISFADNVIWRGEIGDEITVAPASIGLGAGSIDALQPAARDNERVAQFLALLSGDGSREAVETIGLNAASMVVAAGVTSSWPDAIEMAARAIEAGCARNLVEQVRATSNG